MSEPKPRDSGPPKRKRGPRRKKKEGAPASSAPPEHRATRSRGRVARSIAAAAALLILAAGASAFFLVYPSRHGPGQGHEVELDIPGDESPDALAQRLATAGLVSNARVFAAYLRTTGGVARVARGPHLLTDDLSARELLARLERSPFAGHARVTFPEGWTRFDFAKRLQQQRICPLRSFLDATTDPDLLRELHLDGASAYPPGAARSPSDVPASAEGFLFPATYELNLDSDARDVVRKMKAEFDRRFTAATARHEAALMDTEKAMHWGMREIVTLASMIEKEAVVDDERPVIASVFVNRLQDPTFVPKLLQCDPTAGYGCLAAPERAPSCASYTGKITHDLVADAANPYNTYKHEGLPPGPIANPGARSLEAAMAPATTHFFYFVARGEGRHTFSETYGAHTSAIRAGTAPRSQP